MRRADFLAKAAELLPRAEYAVVEGARLFIPEDGVPPALTDASPLLRAYYAWELSLRNELAILRAARLGKTPERYLRPGEPQWDVSRLAHSAAALESPLDGELLIERERWAYLERLETGHYFDLERIVAYVLKLQALERRARFEVERGERAYATAYDSILSGASMERPEGV
jgi:hypothetical protein